MYTSDQNILDLILIFINGTEPIGCLDFHLRLQLASTITSKRARLIKGYPLVEYIVETTQDGKDVFKKNTIEKNGCG